MRALVLRPSFIRMPSVRQILAAWCAFTIWALGIFAASPELHADLHDDCCEPEHTCAITLFSGGVEDGTVNDVLVWIENASHGRLPSAVTRLHVVETGRFPPGRGPPLG